MLTQWFLIFKVHSMTGSANRLLKKATILFAIAILFGPISQAQELNLEVKITTPALRTADPKSLQVLEREIREFMNNQKWTSHEFEQDEKIEGALQINIKEDLTANSFVADFYFSTGRPVYNSNYTTPVINHVEKDVAFSYEELTPLRNNASIFTDNLSAILTFYAYIMIGYDFDTFSSFGGEEFFRTANSILASVPPNVVANDPSWSSLGGERNRYWLIENILSPKLRGYRQAVYNYHRNSLDKMTTDIATSKAVLLSSLKDIEAARRVYPDAMVLQMFSNAKRAEILEIFKNSVKSEQREVYRIMAAVDPAQSDYLSELR